MKMKHISIFFINLIVFLGNITSSSSQNEVQANIESDTTEAVEKYPQKYGLRLGIDLLKPVRSFFDEDYTGFEINGDYRLTHRLFLAGELGTEEDRITTDFLDVTSKGSYFKAGVDYNMYTNWLDMQNMIYGGFRVGVSSFKQTVNSYTIYDPNFTYWNSQYTSNANIDFKGLNAVWAELVFGIKAEVLNNLFIGLNAQLKARITEKEPNDFENLYIPGFGRTYDSGSFGLGFGYNISYLIPIFKKNKTVSSED